MSESDKQESPDPAKLLDEGAADGCAFGCALVGVGAACCAFVALALWGGTIGLALVGAAGFGLAGLVLPWTGEPRGPNQERFTAILSVLFGLGGIVLGAWAGSKGSEFPWWAWAGAALVFAVAGGWLGWRVPRLFGRRSRL